MDMKIIIVILFKSLVFYFLERGIFKRYEQDNYTAIISSILTAITLTFVENLIIAITLLTIKDYILDLYRSQTNKNTQ